MSNYWLQIQRPKYVYFVFHRLKISMEYIVQTYSHMPNNKPSKY